MNWQNVIRGLTGAAINTAVNTLSLRLVDPNDFNFTPDGLIKIGKVALASAIIGAILWLKQHPLKDDYSVDLKRLGAFLLTTALPVLALQTGCAKAAPQLSPEARVVYTADQIVTRLGELQNAVISTNTLTPGAIPDRVAVPIVRFCVESAKLLKETQAGVLPAIAAAWRDLKAAIPPDVRARPSVVAAFVAVDVALAEFGAAGGEPVTSIRPIVFGALRTLEGVAR